MPGKYKIGQILYLVSSERHAVFPVQIVEINQKTTIQGEKISYTVIDTEERGPFHLDEIKAEVFTQTSDVLSFFKNNAIKAIENMVTNAHEEALKKFDKSDNDFFAPDRKSNVTSINKEETKEKSLEVEVVDKNGKTSLQKAKIKSIQMPEGVVG